MHEIFHTQAFVLSTYPTNEANRTAVLFTRELGIIRARVQGVRKSTAKLRSHIVEYSLIKTDLVRGRGMWRMTSAQLVANPFLEKRELSHARLYVRVLGVVERFLGEEEVHVELFDFLTSLLPELSNHTLDQKKFDTLALWKTMALLGYTSDEREMSLFEATFSDAVRALSDAQTETYIKDVNNAIRESHL